MARKKKRLITKKAIVTYIKNHRKPLLAILDIVQTMLVTIAIYVVIFFYIAQPLQVISISMEPNFYDGDKVIVEKVTYRLTQPKRDDVVVVRFPDNEELKLIKRVIGLPGEEIMIVDNQIYINGMLLDEPYIKEEHTTIPNLKLPEGKPIKLGSNEYFVIGDNRARSSDSRSWGPVKEDEILGKVLLRYWPIKRD